MLVIGHRGAAGYAPENTLESIGEALEIGVDAIEVDVQKTKDGIYVLYHDRFIAADNGGARTLNDLTYQDLNALAESLKRPKIPRLEEACQLVRGRNRLIIELKFAAPAARLVDIVSEALSADEFVLASFDHREIAALKSAKTELKTLALIEGWPLNLLASLRETGCDYVGVGFESLDISHVQALKNLKIPIFGWTLDEDSDIRLAITMGLDGIISNYPRKVLQICQTECEFFQRN